MTEEAIQVTDGIEVRGYDLEGINRLLSTNDAGLPGIAVLVMGQEDGEHVSVVCGEPVGQSIVSAADTSLKRAAVVLLSTHYDMRHAGYLHAGIMSGIARSRGLEPRDEETARRIARARVSEEGQEGVRAFLEKRKPSWFV